MGFSLMAFVGNVQADFMGVSPGVIELSVRPGGTAKGKITVTNNGSTPVLLLVESERGGMTGLPILTEEWLRLKFSNKWVVPPHGKKRVGYRVRVPKDLNGEVSAVVFISGGESSAPLVGGGGVTMKMRQGITIYLSARGSERAVLSVADFKGAKRDNGMEFRLNLTVEGNVHVRPKGDILITDQTGAEIERVSVDSGSPVFPGAPPRFFYAQGATPLLPGTYSALLTLTYGESWGPPLTLEKKYILDVTETGVDLKGADVVP